MQLGQKSSEINGLAPTSAAGEEKDKVSFPSFTLRGDKMEEFLKECPDSKEVGYELTATVELKVSGYRDDQFGKELNFDVKKIDDLQDTDEGADEGDEGSPAEEASETPAEEASEQAEPDEEEKILGYKRPQPKKEAHSASGKDMEY